MNLGISMLGVNRHMGGNYQYAITMLEDLASVLKMSQLTVFYDGTNLVAELIEKFPGCKFVRVPFHDSGRMKKMSRLLIGLTGLKIGKSHLAGRYSVLDQNGCDAIFHPYWGAQAFMTNTPSIAAIHDCAPHDIPGLLTWEFRLKLDFLIRSIVRHARYVLVDSSLGKALLEKHYNANPDKVVVLPFRPPNYLVIQNHLTVTQKLNLYRLKPGYLFLPGRWGTYKNTERVLAALKIVNSRRNKKLNLVLSGIHEKDFDLAHNEIDRLGLQSFVNLLGFVPDEDMSALYQGA